MRGLTFVSALGPNAKEAAAKVTPLLSHKDADVRAAAAVALGEMGEERAIAELKRVYLQRAALLRQGRAKWMPPEPAPLGAGQSSGKLKTLMSRVESLQRAKAEGSGKILLSPMPPSELANDVSPQESQAFADILEALGKRSSPEAADELKKWAVDESPSIRAAAYVSLAAMGEAGAAVAKEGLFDSDRFVQSRVAEALAAQGEKGQAALLDAIAKLPGDRVRFLEALYNAGATPAAAFALTELLSEGGAEVAFAASMLGQLRAEPARTPLVRYLADAAAPSRVSVIWALGELGGAEAEAAVVKELYSDNPDVRTAAATALGRMKSTAGSAMLNALKGDYYLDVRNAAEAALAQL
jgi:HEAT repeat protein